MPATAIVLAGGRATRFGGPKLKARLAGVPLLDLAIRAVAEVATEIIVVAGPGEAPVPPPTTVPVRIAHDPEPDGGPLVALAAGLQLAAHPLALVVGGDMPHLRPGVLEAMLARLAAGPDDAVLLAAPDEGAPRQALPMALETTAALAAVDVALSGGLRALQALLDGLRVTELPAELWLRLDPAAGTLDDVDEPADLERLDRARVDLEHEETSP